ncbi:inositol monophosphatase [Methylobacterium durans]|uniref:Inositol monophosphatase n=2 Tax=Methylobacterium durans TaxID=2202825 RepID=A0A2U8WEF9_9HYPH|nr:inositol monophosphatase [Methylobacterium durans]
MLRMLTFVEEAGQLALSMRAAGLQVGHKGDGLGQALTEADLEISRLVRDRFGQHTIEEETADRLGWAEARTRLSRPGWTFVADPIDGTKPYAGGLPGWGTMIAACRSGWPEASVLSLPAWCDDRAGPVQHRSADEERGLILAAHDGVTYWAPTLGGRRTHDLQPLNRSSVRTSHVGWLAPAAQRYTLDYQQGFFPWSESGAIADAALVATGRLDATLSNHKLWDLAPILPVLGGVGHSLYHWPDLGPPPAQIIDMFDADFSGHDDLWLLCRDREQAAALAAAIMRA